MLARTVKLLIALLLSAAATANAGTLSVVGQSRWVDVGTVIDGDTFHTKAGEKIRLLGINAPEIAHNQKAGEPRGQQAKQLLTQLITGKTIKLRGDIEKQDSYGRTLAQLYLRNGIWVNEQLVRSGLAYVYTFPPNIRWASRLLQAEAEARSAKRGIWRTDSFGVLEADKVAAKQIGQFRLVHGKVSSAEQWRFKLGQLTVTVPRDKRRWFAKSPLPEDGDVVTVRGKIRTASGGGLFLALHSPYDLE